MHLFKFFLYPHFISFITVTVFILPGFAHVVTHALMYSTNTMYICNATALAGFGKPESLVSSDGTSITASNKSTLPPLVHLLSWAAGGPESCLHKFSRVSDLWRE